MKREDLCPALAARTGAEQLLKGSEASRITLHAAAPGSYAYFSLLLSLHVTEDAICRLFWLFAMCTPSHSPQEHYSHQAERERF